MIPTNKFLDYSVTDNLRMSNLAERFLSMFEQSTTRLVNAEKEYKAADRDGKKTIRGSRPNNVHVNPQIKAEYIKLQAQQLPLHVIVGKYERWFSELDRLTLLNLPWLGHPTVYRHVAEIAAVCATFQEIINLSKNELSDQSNPPPPRVS